MSLYEIVVEGTLRPDGTLELDQKPHLSPGRVTVVLRQPSQTTPPKEDWLQHLQRIRAEREAAGYPFMNEAQTNEHIAWLREENRIDDLLRQADDEIPRLPIASSRSQSKRGPLNVESKP